MPHWELNPVLVHRYDELHHGVQDDAFQSCVNRMWETDNWTLQTSIDDLVNDYHRVDSLAAVKVDYWDCPSPGTASVRLTGYAFFKQGDAQKAELSTLNDWIDGLASLAIKHEGEGHDLQIEHGARLVASARCDCDISIDDIDDGRRLWQQLEGIVEDVLVAESEYMVSAERFQDWLEEPENNRFTKEGKPC